MKQMANLMFKSSLLVANKIEVFRIPPLDSVSLGCFKAANQWNVKLTKRKNSVEEGFFFTSVVSASFGPDQRQKILHFCIFQPFRFLFTPRCLISSESVGDRNQNAPSQVMWEHSHHWSSPVRSSSSSWVMFVRSQTISSGGSRCSPEYDCLAHTCPNDPHQEGKLTSAILQSRCEGPPSHRHLW